MTRIAITTVQVPFVQGGAESHVAGLAQALRDCGYEVEVVSIPFRFKPNRSVLSNMDYWESEDFETHSVGRIDRVICLKFPSYYLKHPQKIVWLLHQHRAVYELYDTPYGESSADRQARNLRVEICRRDTQALGRAKAVYANSQRVAERLMQYNQVASSPLYHPPPDVARFYSGAQLPYIFFPSRLEELKRQELLIRAMARVRAPAVALLAGTGGARPALERTISELGIHEKVKLLGKVTREEMFELYANSTAVFFGPLDEDLGYVTMEAMLSSKPVITCKDSGGPVEFVIDGQTGFVVDPHEEAVAEAIDRLFSDRALARDLGQSGRTRFDEMGIGWEHVVQTLTA
jgi:glycosyltransferase involved in cell wall biosynthesis